MKSAPGPPLLPSPGDTRHHAHPDAGAAAARVDARWGGVKRTSGGGAKNFFFLLFFRKDRGIRFTEKSAEVLAEKSS